MYTKEQFHETVGILVRAYMKDTLEHADCDHCAVGNLIAAKAPELYKKDPGAWYSPMPGQKKLANDQIKATGYSIEDIMHIEQAFEQCDIPEGMRWNDFRNDQYMLNGLHAVVDVLCEIHGMNETDKQEAKEMFVKA
jgi:hypothetical protein